MPITPRQQLTSQVDESRRLAESEAPMAETPGGLAGFIWNQAKGFFVVMFESVWSGAKNMAQDTVLYIIEKTQDIYHPAVNKSIDSFFRFLYTLGAMDEEDIRGLEPIKEAIFPVNLLAGLGVLLIMVTGFMVTKSQIMLGTLKQHLNKVHSPTPPSPEAAIRSAFIAPEKTAEARDALQRVGYSDTDIDMMFLAAYRTYDENAIRVLWLRGVLSEEKMFDRMRELGYTDTRIKELVQGWSIIPGPQDLFHLVAKEAFEPDSIELMGLADEFPEEQVQWLEKQGVSREWALKYWYAHWEQPSIQMGYEMLHRNVINRDELDLLFRTVEIPPYWRDKLIKIAFNPYTRVDTRRMHAMGVLSDAELVGAYLDQGYDQEKAEKMALFTIRYNAEAQKDVTMSQIIKGFHDDLITRQDAIDLLVEIDYNAEQAEYLVILEEYAKQKELQDDIITNIGTRFQNLLIEEYEVRDQLGRLNLPAAQMEVLIDKWKIKRQLDTKMPSKTDLDKMLTGKIINRDEYVVQMRKLGYGTTYTNWYLQLIQKKK